MQVRCPNCGNVGKTDEVPAVGQHLLCPFCSKKFSYGVEMVEHRKLSVRTQQPRMAVSNANADDIKKAFGCLPIVIFIIALVVSIILSDDAETNRPFTFPVPTGDNTQYIVPLDKMLYDPQGVYNVDFAKECLPCYVRISETTDLRVMIVSKDAWGLFISPPHQTCNEDVCAVICGKSGDFSSYSVGDLAPSGFYWASRIETEHNPGASKPLRRIWLRTIPPEAQEKAQMLYDKWRLEVKSRMLTSPSFTENEFRRITN